MTKTTEKTAETLTRLQHTAYEAFKLHWMITHGYTVADLLDKYSHFWGEVESDEEGMIEFWNYLEETGFNGEIWPCFKEFLDHEFKDVSLMYRLLNLADYTAYLNLVEQVMSESTCAEKHISEVVKGDILLYDGCRYVATSDAYMTATDIGKEWCVDVESNEGSEDYLYASYYEQGFAQIASVKEVPVA